MLTKPFILLVVLGLLLIFYLVISLSASQKNEKQSYEVSKYLFGVRVLIIILAIVGTIMWFFI
tara:strand:+ start:2471 stop:2659 length:189 start_codon:yes stop_codon:yes gene_type:complete